MEQVRLEQLASRQSERPYRVIDGWSVVWCPLSSADWSCRREIERQTGFAKEEDSRIGGERSFRGR